MAIFRKYLSYGCLFAFLAAFFLSAPRASAQSADDDFAFASGLIDWGFSDFALKLADKLLAANPGAADRVNFIRAQSLIAARKFVDAEAIVAKLPAGNPKADAISLALANAYNAMGEMEKARGIYNSFFGRFSQAPVDPDLLKFYRDASYRYAVMLEKAGDLPGALAGYDRVLQTRPEKDIERRVMTDQSQILLKLAQANHEGKRDEFAVKTRSLIDKIQWGGMDIWFGQSIITLANVELIYNDEAKAQKIIKDYQDILKQVDEILAENNVSKGLSPMAGARYLSGQLYQRVAERAAASGNNEQAVKDYAAALNEFYNVFVQYSESEVAPDAGIKGQEIKDILVSRYGKKVNIDLGERANDAAATQVRLADTLYREKKYADAVQAYLKSANQFPEAELTVKSFGNLMMSYINQDDTLMVKTLASYISERMGAKPDGATVLLAAAKHYVDNNRNDLFAYLYDAYLQGYPGHEKAGTILFFLATQRKKAGDESGAAAYFRRIVEDYPKDQFYTKALNQIAWSLNQAGDYEGAITYYRRIVAESAPSMERANAQFSLAGALMKQSKFADAAAELEVLTSWIAPKGNPYATSTDDMKKAASMLEQATFQRAQCLARISDPADKVPEYREQAIKIFDLFVRMFENSDLAPKALSGKGTVLLELKRFDDAAKAFEELANKFPQSEEGKNALFSLARAAMETKQFDQGVAAFEKMMQEAGRYQAEEFVRLGSMMGEAGYSKQAIEAFQQAQQKIAQLPADQQEAVRPVIERSLFGSAQAYYKAGQFDAAINAVNDLLTRFPKSGLFYDAKFLQGEAFRDAAKYPEAVVALSDVFKFASDAALINRATMALAEIQRKHGDKKEALASYQRVALLTDRTKPEFRPVIEDSLFASIEVAGELARFQEVITNADEYAQLFPQGRYTEQVRAARAEAVLKSAGGQAEASPANP